MTIRKDIPGRGTGADRLPVYYAYNKITGQYMALSTPEVIYDHNIVLGLVPRDRDPGDYLATMSDDAPPMATVIEFARNQRLESSRPVSPEVAHALDQARSPEATL